MNNNKIYVGNLSYQATQDDLAQFFGAYGTVTEAVVITDRATGRSKGFGFVTFDSEAAAQEAVEKANGQDFMERSVKVSIARPKRDR